MEEKKKTNWTEDKNYSMKQRESLFQSFIIGSKASSARSLPLWSAKIYESEPTNCSKISGVNETICDIAHSDLTNLYVK